MERGVAWFRGVLIAACVRVGLELVRILRRRFSEHVRQDSVGLFDGIACWFFFPHPTKDSHRFSPLALCACPRLANWVRRFPSYIGIKFWSLSCCRDTGPDQRDPKRPFGSRGETQETSVLRGPFWVIATPATFILFGERGGSGDSHICGNSGVTGLCVRRSARATDPRGPYGGRTQRSFRSSPRAATSALHRSHADSRDRRR
jgi:hypothetical protein